MTNSDIVQKLRELSSNHSKASPINIDCLAEQLRIGRPDLVCYLVDLKLAGILDFDKENVTLARTGDEAGRR